MILRQDKPSNLEQPQTSVRLNKRKRPDHQIAPLELQLEDLQVDEREAAREISEADQAPRKKSTRKPLPDHLPRDEKVYAPAADACPSSGGGLRHWARTWLSGLSTYLRASA